VSSFISRLWSEEAGQDLAEYALMLAAILLAVAGGVGALVYWFRSTFR
jgi:Flp pilus assembly pilin Flp